MALYQRLFDGPIDIIGDVHGEITALRHLLYKLGYDESGCHRKGRRLVFLGDIVDRGPDSPGVVEAVMELVKAGRAQCVLGNHELNILLDRPLHGNGWMVQPNPKERPGELTSQMSIPSRRAHYKAFFESLPVALENDSLRIAHACWHQPAIDLIKATGDISTRQCYQQFEQQYVDLLNEDVFAAELGQEQSQYAAALRDPEQQPPLLPAIAKKETLEQMVNPIRTLTTSSMVAAQSPYFGGGKWRMAERDAWWEAYHDDKPVIIGHFWRRFSQFNDRMAGVFGRDLFADVAPHAWMGAKNNVYCVDYSVGQRHLERKKTTIDDFYGRLAALRMPERQVMHDDGTQVETY